MGRKRYQDETLATLARFATRAREVGPHLAFSETAPTVPAYADQGFGPTPYVRLRLPTGGGKSVRGADAIPLLRRYAEQDYPLTLWLVPRKAVLGRSRTGAASGRLRCTRPSARTARSLPRSFARTSSSRKASRRSRLPSPPAPSGVSRA